MIKVIIFDYDGVIVDSFPAVHAVYQRISKKLGKKCPETLDGFKKIYAAHSTGLMTNLGFTQEEVKKANDMYQVEILKEQPPFFPGIKEIIESLHAKHRLILVSSSPKPEVTAKLKKLGIINCFERIIAGETPGSMKKIPALKALLSDLNMDLDEIVMIGDRLYDHNDAKAVGIKLILVEYGWGYDRSKIPDHKQNVVVNKPSDLIKAIAAIE